LGRQAIPADAVYRQNVEKYTKYRLTVCEAETDLETIERKVMQGQVEELIDQAKDELSLIPKMAGTPAPAPVRVMGHRAHYQSRTVGSRAGR
jgi:hypothetical protein